MNIDLKIYKCRITSHYHFPYSMFLPYDTSQRLTMQEEINVVVFLSDHILIILPEVLVLSTLENNEDIMWLVVWWV